MVIISMKAKVKKILLLLLAAAVYAGYNLPWFQRNYVYVYPCRSTVESYAAKRGLDPALVAGVIYSESKFEPRAKSHKGAIGLMQLMPSTAGWISEQMGERRVSTQNLYKTDINIKFGTWYLQSLKNEFNDNEILLLAAYNAGRGNVASWMNKYGWNTDFSAVEQIPYAETRKYVSNVLKSKRWYQKLYYE